MRPSPWLSALCPPTQAAGQPSAQLLRHAAAAAVAATRRWRQQARQREESSRRGRNCSRANLLWARVAQRRGRPAWRGGARAGAGPGARAVVGGGAWCPGTVLSPGASGPPTGSGRPGRLRSIQGLAAEPGVCLFRAGAGRGARGLRREPAASPGRPHSETTLPSGPTLSCPYCYCLVASRPTVSPDSSFVLTRRTPVPQGVNPGSVGKLHLLAPFSSLPSLAGSLGLVTSTPRQAVFAGPPGLWDHRR
ncbi:unnamed protein product [Rangifer tarandus platyrhynchus]|uniref:Uncharacterized protein n=1 Tax=Rangifer tarandus platyrhynchus TaxID=3082113 RepID=A0AC59ZNH5_RANTA